MRAPVPRTWLEVRVPSMVAALLLTAALAARAQEPPEVPPPPEPILLAEIASAEDVARQLVRDALAAAEPRTEAQAIDVALRESEPQRRDRVEATRATLASARSIYALEREERAWLTFRDDLVDDRNQLEERLTALDQWRATLEAEGARWEATEVAARAERTPVAVLEGIREVRAEIAGAERRVRERRAEVLELQARVSGIEGEVAEVLDAVAKARLEHRDSLLARDGPALWRALSAPAGAERRPVSMALDERVDFVRRFLADRVEAVALHLAFFVALLALVLSIGRRAADWAPDDPRHEAAVALSERPVSAALLVAVAATPLLYPRAPILFMALADILLVVPLVRLLPRLAEPSLTPALYWLAAFILVDGLREIFAPSLLANRLVLLIEQCAAIGLLAWLFRLARTTSQPPRTAMARFVVAFLRLAFCLFLVAVPANLFGWINLSLVLGSGVLLSAYLAAVAYGGVRVLQLVSRVILYGRTAQNLRVVRRHRERVVEHVDRGLVWAAVAFWFVYSLDCFGIRDVARRGFAGLLAAGIEVGTIAVTIGDVVAFVLAIWASGLAARFVRFVLDEDVLPRLRVRRGVASAISATAQYCVMIVGFFLAVAAAGVDLERFVLLAGAFGVGIGFGLQNVVNNFVSGLILLYERPLKVGDAIEVGDVFGEVRRIGVRSSTVRTFEGAEVIVPNATLVSDQVVNWTLSDRNRRMTVRVGVAYGTDPKRVVDSLLEVAKKDPGVLRHPEPYVLFLGFGDSSLDFELRAWTPSFDDFLLTRSGLTLAVNEALTEAGIEVPFPQRDMHLRSLAPEAVRALEGHREEDGPRVT